MLGRSWAWYRDRPTRVKFAFWVLVVSMAGWPLSALTFASREPPTVLGLSWLAITITCVDVLFTSQVHEKHDADKDEGGDGA